MTRFLLLKPIESRRVCNRRQSTEEQRSRPVIAQFLRSSSNMLQNHISNSLTIAAGDHKIFSLDSKRESRQRKE